MGNLKHKVKILDGVHLYIWQISYVYQMRINFLYHTGSRVNGSDALSLNKTVDGGNSSFTTNSMFGSLGVQGDEN